MNSSIAAETILVVDDCDEVCEVIEILLCRVGYRVLTATNGTDALHLARIVPSIDLLMTNVSLPGMPGTEVAACFVAIHPSIPIVFMAAENDPIECPGPSEFLAKPFTVAGLRDTVRRALRTRPALTEESRAA